MGLPVGDKPGHELGCGCSGWSSSGFGGLAVLCKPSVFLSGDLGVSGVFWGSQEGCQGPFRPSHTACLGDGAWPAVLTQMSAGLECWWGVTLPSLSPEGCALS